MNILIVKSTDFPVGTAAASCIRLMIKGLRENGYKAAFISASNFSQLGNKRRFGHYDGCPYIHISRGHPTQGFFSSICRSWQANTKLLLFLLRRRRRGRSDVVFYGNGNFLHDWVLLFGLCLFRLPWFSWSVELETTCWNAHGNFRERINYFSAKLAVWVQGRFACGCVVISCRLAEFYGKRNRNVQICPILIESNEQQSEISGQMPAHSVLRHPVPGSKPPALYPGRKVLLYSGTFEDKDGVYTLLEAVRIARERVGDILLVMTGGRVRRGGDQFMQEFSAHLQKERLSSSVEYLGFVPRQELIRLMYRADLLLVCRIDNPCANYGFPWKLSEYLMTRKPILATDISDISHYFENEKSIFLAKPGNASDIAEKIIRVLSDLPHAMKVANEGRRVATGKLDYHTKMGEVLQFVSRITERTKR